MIRTKLCLNIKCYNFLRAVMQAVAPHNPNERMNINKFYKPINALNFYKDRISENPARSPYRNGCYLIIKQ